MHFGPWFVVGLPVFLYKAGWDFWAVGGFLAIWTIGYGFIQSVAPTLLKRSQDGLSKEVPEARLWIVIMIFVPVSLLLAFAFHNKLFISQDLPSIEALQNYKPIQVAKIISADGKPLKDLYIDQKIFLLCNLFDLLTLCIYQ